MNTSAEQSLYKSEEKSIAVAEESNEHWTIEVKPQTSLLDLRLKDVWRYRDLLLLMVHRDIVSSYKQTILGPLWFVVQPMLTTLIFMLIFGRIARISTDGLPPMVFYLAGITLWNYFAECLNRTAVVLQANAHIFGKVYFPRLIMPLSSVITSLVKTGIQLLLFLLVWAYFYYFRAASLQPNWGLVLTPLLFLLMGALGLGLGLIISSLTTKYRDLSFLVAFGVQLLMYATPVIYSLSNPMVQTSKFKWLIMANPIGAIIETFRYAFTGRGYFHWGYLAYSAGFTLVILVIGTLIFNKVEKNFMDSV